MKGIQGQPEWSLAAASAAFSGVLMVTALWWAYFEGAHAAAHRHVTCRADCRKLSLWSAAHLPLYLGISVAGLGTEHAIRGGGWHVLHGEEAWLLALALSLVVSSLIALPAAR
jgi:low temperature requirement protein LtrA